MCIDSVQMFILISKSEYLKANQFFHIILLYQEHNIWGEPFHHPFLFICTNCQNQENWFPVNQLGFVFVFSLSWIQEYRDLRQIYVFQTPSHFLAWVWNCWAGFPVATPIWSSPFMTILFFLREILEILQEREAPHWNNRRKPLLSVCSGDFFWQQSERTYSAHWMQ